MARSAAGGGGRRPGAGPRQSRRVGAPAGAAGRLWWISPPDRLVGVLAPGGVYSAGRGLRGADRVISCVIWRPPRTAASRWPGRCPPTARAAGVLGGDLLPGRRWRHLPLLVGLSRLLEVLGPRLSGRSPVDGGDPMSSPFVPFPLAATGRRSTNRPIDPTRHRSSSRSPSPERDPDEGAVVRDVRRQVAERLTRATRQHERVDRDVPCRSRTGGR